MADTTPILLWFRGDLRLADNPAVGEAVASGRPIRCLYVLDEAPSIRPMGAASLWWLDKSLRALAADLRARSAGLLLRRGDGAQIVVNEACRLKAAKVVWSRRYEPGQSERDEAIRRDLVRHGIETAAFNASLLTEPDAVRTGDGAGFKVFTPYWRAARAARPEHRLAHAPAKLRGAAAPAGEPPAEETLDAWGLHPRAPDWSAGFDDWTPGEAGAAARLEGFLETGLPGYAEDRERPDRPGTSRLSPHLHFGEIAPWRVLAAVEHAGAARGVSARDVETFDKELTWREFNHQLLLEHPAITRESFRPAFEAMAWRRDAAGSRAWRRGRTGYPIVDAAMRQLWTTGWMHNRLRMVAASFLTKHLLIDWREGEAWFWDTLVDADLANNVANWQWVAGSGADAAPYFRIFNPVLQGERHDPDGAFVRRWVPELARLPNELIQRPWLASEIELRAAGAVLGKTYPAPVVEHAAARTRALEAYSQIAPR